MSWEEKFALFMIGVLLVCGLFGIASGVIQLGAIVGR